MRQIYKILVLHFLFYLNVFASAHGFNANRVKVIRLPSGLYRVVIRYTHVQIGEFREAHADFKNRADADKLASDLINGADFFLGEVKKNVHFHKEPPEPVPF